LCFYFAYFVPENSPYCSPLGWYFLLNLRTWVWLNNYRQRKEYLGQSGTQGKGDNDGVYKLVRCPPSGDWAACIVGRQAAAHRNSSQVTAHMRPSTPVLSYLIISSLYPLTSNLLSFQYFTFWLWQIWNFGHFKCHTVSFMVIGTHKKTGKRRVEWLGLSNLGAIPILTIKCKF
jgi:hypothetical protein